MSKFKKIDTSEVDMRSGLNTSVSKPLVSSSPPTPQSTNGAHGNTNVNVSNLANTLKNKLPLSKSDKIIAVYGVLEELEAYLGLIRCRIEEEPFSVSDKMFLNASIIKIQEQLHDIMEYITTKHSEKNIKQYNVYLDLEINKFNLTKTRVISGSSSLQAQLLYAKCLCRRAERQAVASSVVKGKSADDITVSYLNLLDKYIFGLSFKVLELQHKTPLKY